MAEFRIHVGGIPELRRDLRAVDKALPAKVLPAAHRRAARLVEPHARRLSPKGATGRTERSHRVLASQRRGAVAAGSKQAYYAKMVFFGTGPRRTSKGANRGRVAANKWLDRALEVVGETRIVSVFDDELAKLLRQHGLG